MTDITIPPEVDGLLSRLYADKGEKVTFYCFEVPKWGVTIDESRIYDAWISQAAGPLEPKTFEQIAEAVGSDVQTFSRALLDNGVDITLAAQKDERFEASLGWLAWCLNNRRVKIDDRNVTVEQLKRLLPVDAVRTFMKLFGPSETGEPGNGKA